jgi:prophage maintenance system killer protein
LRLPSLSIIVAINHSIRQDDEWFDEPDELDRIERILTDLQEQEDPVVAAATAVGRIARSQAFAEGNKRTALLVGRWILDRNGIDGLSFIPEHDTELGNLLFSAARGIDETKQIISLFESRREFSPPFGGAESLVRNLGLVESGSALIHFHAHYNLSFMG